MAKRGRPRKTTSAPAKKTVAKKTPVETTIETPVKKEKVIRYTGSHQTCPRCNTSDTVAYKSMEVDRVSGIRVQYRRCRRGHCRHEFKATLNVQ